MMRGGGEGSSSTTTDDRSLDRWALALEALALEALAWFPLGDLLFLLERTDLPPLGASPPLGAVLGLLTTEAAGPRLML